MRNVNYWVVLLTAGLLACPGQAAPLTYAPAPPDNPLKGFVPYAGQAKGFPHSLEFNYLPLRALMTGPRQFDWQPLENLLTQINGRGCQAVFRVYLEYPGKTTGIPQFLLDDGLKVHTYTNTNTQPFPPTLVMTPDYEDVRLRAALTNFIAALGSRYDGDPRIGFITAGLLGTWGEWHTWPRNDLWASKIVQSEVLDGFERAFHQTPVLLRYPAGTNHFTQTPNHLRRFGYHDDSFAWATLPTAKQGDDWFFLTALQKAGPQAAVKWQSQPIGGEVRPEVWSCLWNADGCAPKGQAFLPCVEQTHATWLMDSSIARPLTPEQRDRALAGARRLGYEFHIAEADIQPARAQGEITVQIAVTNTGVAPFYQDWPVELGALDAVNKLAATWHPGWKLTGLLPQMPARTWEYRAKVNALPPGTYRLVLRVPNPMPGGRPLRFANREQARDVPEWLTLGNWER